MKSITAPPAEWGCGIRISLIPKSGEPYRESFELPAPGAIEHWGQRYTFRSPVSVDIEASCPPPAGDRIFVKISIRADISLPCSRCLRETGLAIVGDLRYLFTLRSSWKEYADGSDEADQDGDADVIPVDAFEAELDLTSYVWEVLVLSLPEGVLCSGGCKGLCPICGKDKNEGDCGCKEDNTDPRLAVLREL